MGHLDSLFKQVAFKAQYYRDAENLRYFTREDFWHEETMRNLSDLKTAIENLYTELEKESN